MSADALELIGIEKSFPGVRALRGVSLTVAAGEVHALVGENGAGKSTLIKIATGAQQPDAGSVVMEGALIPTVDRAEMHARGLRCIYQERQVVPDLSVAENVMLDELPRRAGFIDWRTMRATAAERLHRLGIELDLDRRVRGLSVAQLQLIEIARALSDDARLVVMDEPTAALHRSEVQRLFEVVRALRANDVAVLYISHHLDEIFELADRVTVLRDGEAVDTVEVADLDPADLVEMMFGRRVEEATFGPNRRSTVRWRCELRGVVVPGQLAGIDLDLRQRRGPRRDGRSRERARRAGRGGRRRDPAHCGHGCSLVDVGMVTSRRATSDHIALLPSDRKASGPAPRRARRPPTSRSVRSAAAALRSSILVAPAPSPCVSPRRLG